MPARMLSGTTDSHRASTRITRATRAARRHRWRPSEDHSTVITAAPLRSSSRMGASRLGESYTGTKPPIGSDVVARSGKQDNSGGSANGVAAGFDQGLLERLGMGATNTAGAGDVHESVHY